MSQQFDAYERSYGAAVQSSIDFSGLKHDFFLAAKADLLMAKVATHFGASATPALLDVGCGVGALHSYLRPIFGNISGVDVSAACIETARACNPTVGYDSYDGKRLPFADNVFDMVLTVCVMHHVPPAQWSVFMAEMARVTRTGGLVAVIEHNPWNPLTRLAVARCEFDADAVLLSSGQTQRLMREANLKSVASDFFLLLPTANRVARSLERKLSGLAAGAQYLTLGER
jgi:SAM-dependent methyltransferase